MMINRAIGHCKPLPDFSRSHKSQVRVELDGKLVDDKLAEHLRHSPQAQGYEISVAEYQVLCDVIQGEKITGDELKSARKKLLQAGIIKSQGSGRATSYSLALDTSAPQELFNGQKNMVIDLLHQIAGAGEAGVAMSTLEERITGKNRDQIKRILRAMTRDGLVQSKGKGRGAVWVATDKGNMVHHSITLQLPAAME